MNSEIKDVLYCIDGGDDVFVKCLEMSILSMTNNYKGLKFHVIYSNVSDEARDKLEKRHDVRFYPFPERFNDKLKEFERNVPKVAHYSIFYRLFAADVLPSHVKRVIHVDADVICNNPVELSMKSDDVIKSINRI